MPRQRPETVGPGTCRGVRRPVESTQYTSAGFADLADNYQVVLSLGRTGQCWDNALAESFFASLKGELIDLQTWPTQAAARRAIVEYNGTRLHSTLGYLSPAEFEVTTGKEDLGASSLTSHQPRPSRRGNPIGISGHLIIAIDRLQVDLS
jgi:Integrase core domain